jgi:hypothetical protein
LKTFWTLFYDSRFSVGIICSSIQKIALIILIFKLIKERNYMYLSIVSLAFLLIFLYLFSTTSETSYVDFKFLMLQNILTSVLGGIAVSSYMIDDNRKNSWLLISILLFIGLRFMLFIQSFYLNRFDATRYKAYYHYVEYFCLFHFVQICY